MPAVLDLDPMLRPARLIGPVTSLRRVRAASQRRKQWQKLDRPLDCHPLHRGPFVGDVLMTSDEHREDDLRLIWRELRRLRKASERLLVLTGIAYGLGLGLAFLMVARMFA